MNLIKHITLGGRVCFSDTGTIVDVKEIRGDKIIVCPLRNWLGELVFNKDGSYECNLVKISISVV